jgi:CubicO group peptidase (beta-lactamase class C family)
MIVSNKLILGLIIFTYSCGTSQQNNVNKENGQVSILTPALKQKYAAEIKLEYEKLLGNNFSGEIIVAKNGEIIFEDYKGFSIFDQKKPITAETPIHLASISKTFTGMALLKLWEQHLIGLSDPVNKYLPKFPYSNVTIEQLLSHRSGLPDYTHLMNPPKFIIVKTKNKRGKWIAKTIKNPNAKPYKEGFYNNADVLNFLIEKQPAPQFAPNATFKYCNTNFVILALIIEKVTGIDFPTYLQETIFTPLQMKNTFVLNEKAKERYLPSYNELFKPYKIEKYDYIYGDKNVYSTVNDMLLWDKALRADQYLSQTTLSLAYEPKSPLNNHYQNYGYAWRMIMVPNQEKIIYHNGWWHGNNTVFARLLKGSTTIIILGNKTNKNIYRGKQLFSVFTGLKDTTTLIQ